MMASLRRGAAVLVVSVLSAVALSACGGSDGEHKSGPRYVALGDSAVSGAGIGRTAPPCYNSRRGYAALVARETGVDNFVDASCPSATTEAITGPQTAPDGEVVPPQLEAVTPDTDVITISIGGNDNQYVPQLFTSCYSLQNSEAACRKAVRSSATALAHTEANIVGALEAIKEKAPDALVVMVNYLRIMPDSGTCDPDVVRIASDDLSAAAEAEDRLAVVMKAAADKAGVSFVDMRKRSKGHDACAGDDKAWVSGATAKPGDGTFLHPRAKGAEAVAKAVVPVVASRLKN
jgi:lysophospholipase L1-like esterase